MGLSRLPAPSEDAGAHLQRHVFLHAESRREINRGRLCGKPWYCHNGADEMLVARGMANRGTATKECVAHAISSFYRKSCLIDGTPSEPPLPFQRASNQVALNPVGTP